MELEQYLTMTGDTYKAADVTKSKNFDGPAKAYYEKWLDSGKKPEGSPGDYKEGAASKADKYHAADEKHPASDNSNETGNDQYNDLDDDDQAGKPADQKKPGKAVLMPDQGGIETSIDNGAGMVCQNCGSSMIARDGFAECSSCGAVISNSNTPALYARAEFIDALKSSLVSQKVSLLDRADAWTHVKAISDDGYRVGGYLAVFTGPEARDSSPWQNPDGTKGEYFTAETDFAIGELFGSEGIPVLPTLYHHALDDAVKATAIGVIDKIEKDHIGLWAEAQLNKRNAWAKKARDLALAGKLSWSSGALPQAVKKARDGRITRWPLIEGSLTPTPAMPEGLTDVSVMPGKMLLPPLVVARAFKALDMNTDALGLAQESSQPAASTDARRGTEATKPAAAISAKQIANERSRKMLDALQSTEAQSFIQAQVAAALKSAQDTAAAEVANKAAREKEIADEVQKRLDAAKAAQGQQHMKALPVGSDPATNGGGAGVNVNDPSRLAVIGDRRWMNMSAEDMSYFGDIMMGLANLRGGGGDKPMNAYASRFFQDLKGDESHRYSRELAAKTFREVKQGKLSAQTLLYMPFKTEDAVYANSVTESFYKANELDNSGQSSYGLEWIPTSWSTMLMLRARISNPVAINLMPIDMPTATFKVPFESLDPTVGYATEATDLAQLVYASGGTMPPSKLGTAFGTLTAKKLFARLAFSTEENEDSIIPFIPNSRRQTMRALLNYIDDTILNGDTTTTASTNINLIDGTPPTAPSLLPNYLAFTGMRYYCLITNTAQAIDAAGASPTLSLVRKARFKLANQYAVNLRNLACIVDAQTYQKLLNMPEVFTFQNLGEKASALTGVLPMGADDLTGEVATPAGYIDGMPVYVSAQLGLTQSSGKISATPSNNTFGQMVIFPKDRWYLGYRRQPEFNVFQLTPLSDTFQVVSTVRFGITPFDTQSCVLLYDINVS